MRLERVILSGFKSFVDTTNVAMPSNLVGVVGPNGCGKSNIIDAVRWVMGELSAKHLRGESMADVIFNGSANRPALGQASVELVFDNQDGGMGGEYAGFSQISVRRQVSADGSSQYYLNNTQCRRRDIMDLFLGTGLGPRSYAVIEQGTISRFIEAKPEELRNFLEEAAGISKYKERRRETENRIKHTRENLDRLSDLRDELSKQLSHLQRQANAAEKYKLLKADQDKYQAELLALKWLELNEQCEAKEQALKHDELQLEAMLTEQRHYDAELEKNREGLHESHERFNEVQGEFYALGADIARLEQSIAHQKERAQQLQVELNNNEQEQASINQELNRDNGKSEELRNKIANLDPEVSLASEKQSASKEALQLAEQALADWQQRWEDFQHEHATAKRALEVGQTKLGHLEQRSSDIDERISQISHEIDNLPIAELQTKLGTSEGEVAELGQLTIGKQQQLDDILGQIKAQREASQNLNREISAAGSELQKKQGRHASLEALQQAALGKDNKAFNRWLSEHNLAELPRLAECLKVNNGWELALETVLGQDVDAVCIDHFDAEQLDVFNSLSEGRITLAAKQAEVGFMPGSSAFAEDDERSEPQSLFARLEQGQDYAPQFLKHVYTAATLAEAKQQLAKLKSHESIITQDGAWLSSNWLRLRKEEDSTRGVLARTQEIKQLQAEIEAQREAINELNAQLADNQQQLNNLETERDNAQRDLAKTKEERARAESSVRFTRNELEQAQAKTSKLRDECARIENEKQQLLDNITELKQTVAENQESIEAQIEQSHELQNTRDQVHMSVQEARSQAQQNSENAHELNLSIQALRLTLTNLDDSFARLNRQQEQLVNKRQQLQAQLGEQQAPIQEQEQNLEELLNKRLNSEEKLRQARQVVEEVEAAQRDLEQKRSDNDEATLNKRSALEKQRMQWQETNVRRTTIIEQLNEMSQNIETIKPQLTEEANIAEWESELEKIENRIKRLGPINLAAIDEYKVQAERKDYLDQQNDDLISALSTLENAIRKIDKETKSLFSETFEKVNAGFQQFFPRLFGGGSARLDLTSDDLLTAGVILTARPPGKRNTTIHLLSGGEKALTAISLIFSIFKLNPAPFCLLDEVDAPLDDANVGRFCSLVKEMSEQVQFIFISHNKVTMEMAEQLTGVTMNEPGVSRLVAVDINEAIAMAEA